MLVKAQSCHRRARVHVLQKTGRTIAVVADRYHPQHITLPFLSRYSKLGFVSGQTRGKPQ